MSDIRVLPPEIIKKIAAGEVVERPASIVKELVENAIDAGSTSISIDIKGGGIQYIRVSDNGCGIAEEDIPVAFLRHSTSKINSEDDLFNIHTLGFRGEALFSIAAVSQTKLETKTGSSQSGFRIVNHGGEIIEQSPFACSDGTSVTVKNVFFNMPARLKFLKAVHLEATAVGEIAARLLLGNPNIAFKFSSDGKVLYQSPGNGDLKAAIYAVYGADTVRNLIAVDCQNDGLRLRGYIGNVQIALHNRSRQYFYVNGRYVDFAGASFTVQQAFGSRLMVKRYPFYVLFLDTDASSLDVNVHPQKLNVRFSNEKLIKEFIREAICHALQADIPEPDDQASNLHHDTLHEITDNPNEAVSLQSALTEENPRERVAAVLPVTNTFALPQKGESVHEFREILIEGRGRQTAKHTLNETSSIGGFESSIISSGLFINDYDYLVVGQAFDTYLVIQAGDKLLLIDQHAAHERLLYEQFMQDIAKGKTASQGLLMPYILHLSPNEYGTFQENTDTLKSIGFALDEFGGYSVRISAVPYLLGRPQIPAFFEELLSRMEEIRHMDSADIKKEAIIKMACRKAIKAGDKLSGEEIEAILHQYGDGSKPLTCPHGRPIVLAIEKKALEKGFKRLV